ncbi:MAG: hypothetical protein ACTHU0_17440 [Kofleriaceae bacterium]
MNRHPLLHLPEEEPGDDAREKKFDANDEALLIAVACSRPPSGRARRTLQLLADEMVRLTTHESNMVEMWRSISA